MHRGTHSSEQRRGEARAPADAQSVHLSRNQPGATGGRVLARCTRMPWHARVFQPCRPQFFGAVSMWWCPGRCASTHVLTEPRLVRLPAGIQANFPSLSQVADVWKRVYARCLHLLALLQFRMPVRSWLCLERLPTVLSPVQGKFESVNRPLTRQDRQCVVSPFVGDACANGHEVGSSHDHSLVQGIG